MEEEKIIYETTNFVVYVPIKPHVSREEGGHLCIMAKDKNIVSRINLDQKQAKEYIRLSMMVGEAMTNALNKTNINILRINYQENGNWSFLKGEPPFFHLHLYGRAEDAIHQKFGQALYLPSPESTYYDNLTPLNTTDKYNLENWL